MSESVVITVPDARLYRPRACYHKPQRDVCTAPERVWVGVPELPTVMRSFHRLSTVRRAVEIGPGDPIVLAEPCPDDPADGRMHGCRVCKWEGFVRRVSARVADDDLPAIVPVVRSTTYPADNEPDSVIVVGEDGRAWQLGREIKGEFTPGGWAVRVAGAEDYQP